MKTCAAIPKSQKNKKSLKPKKLSAPAISVEKPRLKELVVKRSRWSRGHDSKLRVKSGHMCILGHYLYNAGVPAKALVGVGSPDAITDADEVIPLEASWLLDTDESGLSEEDYILPSDVAIEIMQLNDDDCYDVDYYDLSDSSGTARENQLIKMFAGFGVTLRFI